MTHPVKAIVTLAPMHRFNGKRCFCHGHCRECDLPVAMNKLGRYVHIVNGRLEKV